MKFEVTSKALRESANKIYCIGYCDAAYLFRGVEPQYFNAGVYGWNYDAYIFDYNVVITMGYRPIGKLVDYKLVNKYNEKARDIYEDFSMDYKKRVKKVATLRKNFLKQLRKVSG